MNVSRLTARTVLFCLTRAGRNTIFTTKGRLSCLLQHRLTGAVGPLLIASVAFLGSGRAGAQGTLTNGWTSPGDIAIAGQSDTWTFTANKGDAIVLRVGKVFINGFSPKIQLFNPNNVLMASSASSTVAEVAVNATNSGTFSVIISDNAGTQTNDYRLTLAKTGDPVLVAPGDEGGPMTNGWMHLGNIDVGDLDVWTFTANAGDALIVRAGKTNNAASLSSYVRLFGPTGVQVGLGNSSAASEVAVTATNSGTYLVVVADGSVNFVGSGAYRLTLAKTGDPVFVAPGDEGGPMTNGWMHMGNIDIGDLDVWTFTANAGDALIVRAGKTNNAGNLDSYIRLFGPNGAQLGLNSSSAGAEVAVTATNSGTYLVVMTDGSVSFAGSGAYRLTLAKTGDPVFVAPGDEGGPMTNGWMHLGNIDIGDLDVWTFTANAGDALIVRAGKTNNAGNLDSYIRLFGPNGAQLGLNSSAAGAEVAVAATNSGTYLVVMADGNVSFAGSGAYRLTLAKTGVPVFVAPGDEGGPMTNGWMHLGNIDVGDLDVWTFTANVGDALIVRAGKTNNAGNLDSYIRLFGPSGAQLGFGNSAGGSEVAVTATNSGTYLVVVADGNVSFAGSGAYRLTLAKTGVPVFVAPGDEGGPMNGSVTFYGNMDVGDLDAWSFTACAGEAIVLQMSRTNAPSLTPWVRLYGRDGTLLNSVANVSGVLISRTAPATGSYLVVLADDSVSFNGSGAYIFSVNALASGLKLCSPIVLGTNADINGVGGTPGAGFVLLTATNVTSPVSLWTPLQTNQFDQYGDFNYTNLFSPGEPKRFFRSQLR